MQQLPNYDYAPYFSALQIIRHKLGLSIYVFRFVYVLIFEDLIMRHVSD